MKPRHARAIRFGIQAARQGVRPVMFASDLMAAAYKPTRRPREAAETFTHTRAPGTVPRATEDKTTHPQGEQ